MSFDPYRSRRRYSNMQTVPMTAGPGPQYLHAPQPPTVLTGPAGGGMPLPLYGTPGTATHPGYLSTGQQTYVPPQYVPQAPPQPRTVYGNSHAADYIAAADAAEADLVNNRHRSSISGPVPGAGGGQFGQSPTTPYNVPGHQGTTTAGLPIPGATLPAQRMAHSYPGSPTQPGYNHDMGDFILPQSTKEKRKKSKVDRLLEELLAGSALAATIKHENKQRRRGSTVTTDPAVSQVPRDSALGFLHPKGHFVPSALDDMIDHFVHGKKDKKFPEDAKTGYLHPAGYFLAMDMAGLVQAFKHTLLGLHHQKRHNSQRNAERGIHNGETSDSSSDSDD